MTKTKLLIIVAFIAGFIALGAFGLLVTKGCAPDNDTEETLGAQTGGEGPDCTITGPRTKANVVANMRPLVLRMRKVHEEHRERNPHLRGRIELALSVEWNGEIGTIRITESTLSDPQFEQAVLFPVQCADFDAWTESEEDTEILYPIIFG